MYQNRNVHIIATVASSFSTCMAHMRKRYYPDPELGLRAGRISCALPSMCDIPNGKRKEREGGQNEMNIRIGIVGAVQGGWISAPTYPDKNDQSNKLNNPRECTIFLALLKPRFLPNKWLLLSPGSTVRICWWGFRTYRTAYSCGSRRVVPPFLSFLSLQNPFLPIDMHMTVNTRWKRRQWSDGKISQPNQVSYFKRTRAPGIYIEAVKEVIMGFPKKERKKEREDEGGGFYMRGIIFPTLACPSDTYKCCCIQRGHFQPL